MRVLIVGINFYPELTGIGKYSGEMAKFLSKNGHQISMITAPPYYPFWRIDEGYKSWKYIFELWQNVEVVRCPLWVPRTPSGSSRLIHLFSFALSSFPILLWELRKKPDVVVCIAPAIFCAPFVLFAARLSGSKSWLHIQDFELDAATRLGMLSGENVFIKAASKIERWILKSFTKVSTISESMVDRLIIKGVRSEQAVLFPNWVNTDEIYPINSFDDSFRKKIGIPSGHMVILYSGNMGKKQGLENLIAAAKKLAYRQDIIFILCGEGVERTKLVNEARGFENIIFLPLQPLEKLNQLLNTADIHILPQKEGAADLVMPSKLLGILASGKPVIATAFSGTELEKVVSKVGVVIPPGDNSALCDSIIMLASSSELRRDLGRKGREFVRNHWDESLVLSKFEIDLLAIVNL